jgi:hypothetical protein
MADTSMLIQGGVAPISPTTSALQGGATPIQNVQPSQTFAGGALQPSQPAMPSTNFVSQQGVQNGGAFLPGPTQVSNDGGQPWNLNFEPVNGNPFATNQTSPTNSTTLRAGMYQQ